MLKNVSLAVVVSLVSFLLFEGLIRLVYVVRNAAVDTIPLPYVFGQVYGFDAGRPYRDTCVDHLVSEMHAVRIDARHACPESDLHAQRLELLLRFFRELFGERHEHPVAHLEQDDACSRRVDVPEVAGEDPAPKLSQRTR